MTESIFTENASFEPFWWEAAPLAPMDGAALPKACDVAILGAGFTGLSAALVLARAGRSVVVLDAAAPGAGASARNGGMIGSGHRVGFEELARRWGRETAAAIHREGLASLDFTVDLIEREGIDCQFARSGRFRAAWRPAHYEAMAREVELLRREFGLEADLVPRAEQHREVATDLYHGGCVYHRHGALHPALFHKGLLDRAVSAGAQVAGHTPATALARDGHGFAVDTPRGRLAARDVIVATNGYTGPVTPPFRRRLVPVPSYIIATEPLDPTRLERLIPGGRMIVETRSKHGYYRLSPDGRRVLFGGRAALYPIDTRTSAARLRALMVGLFPDLEAVRISHSWTGFVAFTGDRLPHVGRRDGIHYAMGYGGSGVAMAPYLGHKVAHKLLGAAEGDCAFDRVPFRAIPFYTGRPWFLPVMDAWYRLRDRVEGPR